MTTYPYLEVLLDTHRSLAGGHTCPELEKAVRTTPQIFISKGYPMRVMEIAYVGKDYTLRQLRRSQHRERNQTDDRGDGFRYVKSVEGM